MMTDWALRSVDEVTTPKKDGVVTVASPPVEFSMELSVEVSSSEGSLEGIEVSVSLSLELLVSVSDSSLLEVSEVSDCGSRSELPPESGDSPSESRT